MINHCYKFIFQMVLLSLILKIIHFILFFITCVINQIISVFHFILFHIFNLFSISTNFFNPYVVSSIRKSFEMKQTIDFWPLPKSVFFNPVLGFFYLFFSLFFKGFSEVEYVNWACSIIFLCLAVDFYPPVRYSYLSILPDDKFNLWSYYQLPWLIL